MTRAAHRIIEKEASYFAACLLIPQNFIVEDLKNGIDLGDDKTFDALCKKYDVTRTTMAFRLSMLRPNLQLPKPSKK